MTTTSKPPLQMPPRDLSQRPEVHRNVWYATVSRMEDAGEHWKRRRKREQIGIAGERNWTDLFTLRRVVVGVIIAVICGLLLAVC